MQKVKPAESIEDKKRNLCFASSHGEMETVQELLKQGIDANCIYEGERYITTPLRSAISGNQEKMMIFLIDQGADPSIEIANGKSYHTCLASDEKFEKRLRMIEILYTKKPEMAEEIAEYITNRIPYLRQNDRLDETINSEKSQSIIKELEQINQARLKHEEDLKELEKQTRETLGLDKVTQKNSFDETKSESSSEEKDPNHKNPANKIKPNPSQSSPIVPAVTNSGCVIS